MRSLIKEGVDTVFGYPGGSIMPVFDAMYDHRGDFRQVLVRHEQGAVHAAQGYARSSGRVGVSIVTSGPGATNTLTGISDAMLDSTPVVVIAGQVGCSVLGTDAFQEIDFVGLSMMQLELDLTKLYLLLRKKISIALKKPLVIE